MPSQGSDPSGNIIGSLKHSEQTEHQTLSPFPLQAKLEEALHLAVDFHNSLQDFINWLTQAEQTLNMASRPSLILDTILFQIDEHKVRQKKACAFMSEESV